MKLPIRIYYEDTDCGGVVYYANYLRYFERGRTEYLREKGISLPLLQGHGFLFVVARAEMDYISPARYDDLLILDTSISEMSRTTITFIHSIKREGADKEIIRGTLILASVNREGRPVRLPAEIKAILQPSREEQ